MSDAGQDWPVTADWETNRFSFEKVMILGAGTQGVGRILQYMMHPDNKKSIYCDANSRIIQRSRA
jgi:hypothetical protein